MKRTLVVLVFTLCCVVVIASSLATQHRTQGGASSRPSASGPQYLADGTPQPPLPTWLVADGTPQPPLPPSPSCSVYWS